MKIKTAELTGQALDWAVAKCEGYQPVYTDPAKAASPLFRPREAVVSLRDLTYSSNRSLGWKIVEGIGGFQFKNWLESKPESKCEAHIHNHEGNWIEFGPTPLIAALRCYVASKLGMEIEVPDTLLKPETECEFGGMAP